MPRYIEILALMIEGEVLLRAVNGEFFIVRDGRKDRQIPLSVEVFHYLQSQGFIAAGAEKDLYYTTAEGRRRLRDWRTAKAIVAKGLQRASK